MSFLKRVSLFGLLLALTVVPAIAQDFRGNIYLTVTTEDGEPIEGATVTAIGAGGSRTADTAGDGKVRFSRLDPGFYTVEVAKDGFNTAVYERVELNTGANVEMDIALVKTQVVERVVVTSRTPVLDKRKTGTSTVVSPREIEQIPTARDPWAILSTIPGLQADRINVGGNQSGQQSGWAAKGDDGDNATWVMDGVEFTDLAAQGGSSTYFDFNSFQEVGFTTGGGSLEQTTPGQQLSFVTKQGANRHTGSIGLLLADEDFQDDQTGYVQPDGSTFRGDRIVEVFEKVFEIGGPIVKDKVWYWAGFSQNDIDIAKPAGANTEQPDRTKLRNTTGKINGTVGGKTNWKAFYTRGDKIKIGRNASNSRPPETTWNQSGPTPIYTGDVSHFFTPNFELQFQVSSVGGGFGLAPQGTSTQILREDFVWGRTYVDYLTDRPTDQFAVRGNWFTETGNVNHELRFGFKYKEGSVQSFLTYGTEGIVAAINNSPTVGYTEAWLYRGGTAKSEMEYLTIWAGDTMLFGNWTVNFGATWQQQEGVQASSTNPANGLFPTILPALSFSGADPNFEWDDILYRAGATYTFDTARRQLIRFSAGKYADQLGAGDVDYNHPVATSGIDFEWNDLDNDKFVDVGEIATSTGSESWTTCRINTTISCNSNADCPTGDTCQGGPISSFNVDPANPTAIAEPSNFISTSFEAPTVDEFLLGYEIEVAQDFTIGINYTMRERENTSWTPLIDLTTIPSGYMVGDNTDMIGILTSADYEAQTPDTGTIACSDTMGPCGLTGNGAAFSVQQYTVLASEGSSGTGRTSTARRRILQNRPGYSEDFESIELTATKRLSNRWMLRAFASFQDWTKNVPSNAIQDPSNLVGDTTLDGSDVGAGAATTSGAFGDVVIGTASWQYNINGLYQLPKNFTISANLNGREGYAQPLYYQSTTSGTAIGTARSNMQVANLNTYRFDDVHVLDLGLSYLLQLGGDTTVDLGLTAFNVLGDDTILQRERALTGGNAGRIDEVLSPQVFRISAKVTF